MVWEEELERAGLPSCRGRNHEVEDGAEVVGGYGGDLGAAKGDVGEVLADGDHEGWGQVARWERPACGAGVEGAGADDGEGFGDWSCCCCAEGSEEDGEEVSHDEEWWKTS